MQAPISVAPPRALLWAALALLLPVSAAAQVKAEPPKGPMTPAWDKGIQAINRDSYWNAVACGKQGGQNPACVFWDTGLCKNDDFTLAFFTPYKQVAYEVWQAVRHGQEPPTPSYVDAQHTRVTIGVTPIPAAKNPIVSLAITRGGQTIKPATQSLDGGGGRFIFDFAPFAPTAPITIAITGRAKTVTCLVSRDVLAKLR